MLAEDVNGDFRAFEIDIVELDRLFLKGARGLGKAMISHSPTALIDTLEAERRLTHKPTELRKLGRPREGARHGPSFPSQIANTTTTRSGIGVSAQCAERSPPPHVPQRPDPPWPGTAVGHLRHFTQWPHSSCALNYP
jgi:hypothetical protein